MGTFTTPRPVELIANVCGSCHTRIPQVPQSTISTHRSPPPIGYFRIVLSPAHGYPGTRLTFRDSTEPVHFAGEHGDANVSQMQRNQDDLRMFWSSANHSNN